MNTYLITVRCQQCGRTVNTSSFADADLWMTEHEHQSSELRVMHGWTIIAAKPSRTTENEIILGVRTQNDVEGISYEYVTASLPRGDTEWVTGQYTRSLRIATERYNARG